jgi:hypothetical protein
MPLRTRSPALPRHAFEARSVQLIAAWTLTLAGMAGTQALNQPRAKGAASSHHAVPAPGIALPPLTARLPRK